MSTNCKTPRKALNKAFQKVKPSRDAIEVFKTNLNKLLDNINDYETEEFHKNLTSEFLTETYYRHNHFLNTKGRNDLVIHNGNKSNSSVGVIIETKSPSNRNEMLTHNNLNTKALQELVLYYLRERITSNNLDIKNIIVSNINEWFIFDAIIFDKVFAQNKNLVQQFNDFENKRLSATTTDFFYREIAAPMIEKVKTHLEYTYFDLQDYKNALKNSNKAQDNKLIALYKVLSPEHLLKLPFANDSNTLDKSFYSELLHIIGLSETKNGNKKVIERNIIGKRESGTIVEDTIIQLDSMDKLSRLERISQYGETKPEQLFSIALELSITWINRVLFLKLLEAQLLTYHNGDKAYSFLNKSKIGNYNALNSLFFQVLAKKFHERNQDVIDANKNIPYLNSSLFDPTTIEHDTIFINNLSDNKTITILSSTVLKDNDGKKRKGQINTLEYLLEFLDAYDFSSEGGEQIQEENKSLINASVLGLIFEKINGYKDGSFFTPGFITMYMCRETIRRAAIQKFNEMCGWKCETIDDVYDKIEDRTHANQVINSIKICDPAVGSGHFLVSALNEIIALKHDLKILQDMDGRRLKEYDFEVVNDEIVITDEEGGLYEYKSNNSESQRIQKALFHEKQTIIEQCLFGVDINPNSVKICRLRLWIELLKHAYYKNDYELETLPNIDINIKCGNSLISNITLNGKESIRNLNIIDKYKASVKEYKRATGSDRKEKLTKEIDGYKKEIKSIYDNISPREKKLKEIESTVKRLQHQTIMGNQEGHIEELERQRRFVEKLRKDVEAEKEDNLKLNPFEWRFEFPEVLNDNGDFVGFDVIIGNPPYGANFNKNEKNYIKNNYIYTDYQYDIYMSFIELSNNISNNHAEMSMIIPNTLFLNLKTPNIRNLLYNTFNLLNINAYKIKVFDEATVDTVIIEYNNDKVHKDVVNVKLYDQQFRSENNELNYNELKENWSQIVNIYQNSFASQIKNKITNVNSLGEIAKVTQGTKPFQIGKGKPKQNKDILKEKPYVSNYKKNNLFLPLLRGSLMNRYIITWNGDYYVKYGEWLAEQRSSANYFVDSKIVIRQTGNSLISTLDTSKFVVRDNLYTIIINKDNFHIKYILALLNSFFLSWYYQNIINNEVGEALAQVKKGHLTILPIPKATQEQQQPIISLVDKILEAKKDNPEADTSAWEDKIDQLVYKLYDLTDEEIEIVEAES